MDEFNKTPLNRREYITADDPRDITDLAERRLLLTLKKKTPSKVLLNTIVVARTDQGLPKNTTLIQNVLNFFW